MLIWEIKALTNALRPSSQLSEVITRYAILVPPFPPGLAAVVLEGPGGFWDAPWAQRGCSIMLFHQPAIIAHLLRTIMEEAEGRDGQGFGPFHEPSLKIDII